MLVLLLFILQSACGGGGGASPAGVVAVAGITPGSGTAQVAVSATLSATFNADMDPATLNADTFRISGPDGQISGTVSYNSASRAATFAPSVPLMPLATYTATIAAGVKTVGGQALTSDFSWQFTTAADTLSPSVNAVVSSSLFSLNVINLEIGAIWPTIPFASWRNFHSAWVKLEAQKGTWTFNQLDQDVNLAGTKGTELVLVLTAPPLWASSQVNGTVATNVDNMNDWINYVNTVASRYKGKVFFYELWNEPDAMASFSGTVQQLADLSKVAYQTLKQVDPSITVISPAITSGNITYLDKYLAAGGGAYADVIACHFYVAPKAPEAMLANIQYARSTMAKYSIQKPLWNTETGWNILNDDINVIAETWAGPPLSIADASAYIARSYVLSWAAGVERFYWYAWGHHSMGLTEFDLTTPKACAGAYAEVQKWLVNAKFESLGMNSQGTWVAKIAEANGHHAWIVWNPVSTVTMPLPKEWNASLMNDLTGGSVTLTTGSQLTVGPMPVFIEN